MAERAAVNRLTKVRFLPGAQQDASSKPLGLTACIGVGTGFRTYVGSIPTDVLTLWRNGIRDALEKRYYNFKYLNMKEMM